jgi:hypothetical protein
MGNWQRSCLFSFPWRFRKRRKGGVREMTFDKWMEEMAKDMTMEMLLPGKKEYLVDLDKKYNFIGEEEEGEEERGNG